MRKLLTALLLLASPAVAEKTIDGTSLNYQGCIDTGVVIRGLTYNEDNGTLVVINGEDATEVSVPAPVIAGSKDGCANASVISGPTDIICNQEVDTNRPGGIAWIDPPGAESPKYVWSYFEYYNVDWDDHDSHGWVDDDMTNCAGTWHIGTTGSYNNYHSMQTEDYIFSIGDTAWADAQFGDDLYLLAGKSRENGCCGSSQGPSLYAFGPWNDGSPPADGTHLTAEVLMKYGTLGSEYDMFPGINGDPPYRATDRYSGGAWLRVGTDDAIVITGRKSMGTCWYGTGGSGCNSYQGFHCDPYENRIWFIDPTDLECVIAATCDPWSVEPYANYDTSPETFDDACANDSERNGGAAFDPVNDWLFVAEDEVVHVYEVAGGGGGTPQYTLNIQKAGNGTGTVSSSPAGIDCGSDCSHVYDEDTAVTLTPTPSGSDTFSGWSGDAECDGSVTMTKSISCTATFTADAVVPVGCDAMGPWPPNTIDLTSSDDIKTAISGAASGATFRLAAGTYDLSGGDGADRTVITSDNITIRGATGDAADVVLDAGYGTNEIFTVYASGITIADLTLQEAYDHNIHISGQGENLNGILLHNIICRDSGEQCIKVNPNWTEQTGFTDDSTLQCSTIELTSAGRSNVRGDCYTGGIDAHGAWGWTVANNLFEGWWCATGSPAEHAIHFWSSSRDTIVEGNIVLDNARGIGLGLSDSGFERTYTPDPYPSAYMGHADGVIRNNFVACADSGLHASEAGCDTGIGVESGPGVDVYNNTVMATGGSVGLAIDYRYPDTDVVSVNNATDGSISTRNSATISVDLTNLESMSDAYVTSISTGDLHLAAGASNAIDQGTAGYATTDFDGDPRDDGSIDIGADEYDSSPAPTPVEQGQKEDGASTSGVKKE